MSRQASKAQKYVHVATSQPRNAAPASFVAGHLKIATAAAMFAGLALTPKLWLGERIYPLTPAMPFLGSIPAPMNIAMYAALLILLALIAIVSRPAKFIGVFAALAIALALFDQSRWQPWFYQYLIMLGALAWYYRHPNADDDHPALSACRLVIVCTYFWSGVQKLQSGFINLIFPWMIEPFTKMVPHAVGKTMDSMGIIAPFVEIAIGVGLLLPRLRRHAIFAAIGMHAFILLALGPLGRNYNSVVWPWNIAMVVFLLLLFWKKSSLPARSILQPRGAYHALALLLFGFAPALSFFDLWDKDLSCAMYTGPRYAPRFYVTNALADRLPKQILEHVYLSPTPGTNMISPFDWALAETNAAIYPELRIYKSLGKRICSYAHDPSEMRLVVQRQHVLLSPDREDTYTCPDLTK